jgi:hypothetical protein
MFVCSVVLFLSVVTVARAAQCACICNGQVFAPSNIADCADCTYQQCLTANPMSVCTRLNATVQPACNPVDPCVKAFDATLCITDTTAALGLKCVDMRGVLDPWQLDCKCGPIAAKCLADNGCPFPPNLKAECVSKCGAMSCEPGNPAASSSMRALLLLPAALTLVSIHSESI